VPFTFRRQEGKPAEPDEPETATSAVVQLPEVDADGIAFDGLTEEWRLVGIMEVKGRLSDALNRREAIATRAVSWAPIDGLEPFSPVPGLRSIDPYDLIVVLAGENTLPDQSDEEKAAHRVNKVSYGVNLEVPPYRVRGIVHLFPGSEPERLLDRSSDMFFPVTSGAVMMDEVRIGDPRASTILVNRQYLRRVEQAEIDTLDDPVGPA
jgi:hypothetical protein